MKRIHNVSKWALYDPKTGLTFEGMPGRRIELQFNTVTKARVVLVGEERNTFLAVIDGMDRIEFSADERIVDIVVTSDDEVWYFTNEGQQAAVSRPEAVSFTRMMSRRQRNPQLERMMFEMRQNEARREAILQAQSAEFAKFQADREALKAAAEKAAVAEARAAAAAKKKADADAEAQADAE